MADDTASTQTHLTFTVKSSSDAKYTVTVPDGISVLDLKNKLSTSEYADVPAERQRLIYSGRVLKDPDALSTYNIKDGNTVHMVKGAPSNQQRNSTSQTLPGAGSSAGVPQNLAAGTGNDPLAGLTGARYAGFAQMPSASMFGPDGGMTPQSPDELLRQLENPQYQAQMNEAMNNPDVIRMLENMPMVRDNPMVREMIRNPEMRRMMLDPQHIRQQMQMQRMMGGGGLGGAGGQNSMPAPGVTDSTPGESGQTNPTANSTSPAQNPFAAMGQAGAGGQGNPFAALFGGNPPNAGASNNGSSQPPNPLGGQGLAQMLSAMNPPPQTSGSGNNQSPATSDPTRSADGQEAADAASQTPPNPLAGMLASMGGGEQGQQGNALSQMTQQMMQNPEMMRMAQQMMQNPEVMQQAMSSMGLGGGMGAGAPGTGAGAGAGAGGQGGFNPFSMLGGMGGMGGQTQQSDSRPPEEQYAEQLRQLNDMGFFDFNQNVRALRMSGGRVEGAIEMLLGGMI